MHVDATESRYAEEMLWKDMTVSSDDDEVWLPGLDSVYSSSINLLGLEDRQGMLGSDFFDPARRELLLSTDRLVGLSDDADDIVMMCDQVTEYRTGKLRSPHENDSNFRYFVFDSDIDFFCSVLIIRRCVHRFFRV